MRLFAIAAVVLLVGCAGANPFKMSPDTYVPDGTVITLNQPLTIPGNSISAPVRGGRIETRFNYEAHCRIEVRTLGRKPQVIEPDRFEVVRTSWDWEYYGGIDPRNMYAALITSEGPSLQWYTTYVYLHSGRQPDVYRLRCRHIQESDINPRYLTMAQIQTVLGDVMTVGQ